MDLIIEHYEDMINFANKQISKLGHEVLFEGKDAVHHVIAGSQVALTEISTIKKGILIAIHNYCIPRCGTLYFQENNELANLNIFQPLDQKYCKKCKQLKYIIYDFYIEYNYRHNRHYFHYREACKDCCIVAAEKSLKSRGKSNYRGSDKEKANRKKWMEVQKEKLTDYWIRLTIIKAGQIKAKDITDQMIAQKRQAIIARRAKQIAKQHDK